MIAYHTWQQSDEKFSDLKNIFPTNGILYKTANYTDTGI